MPQALTHPCAGPKTTSVTRVPGWQRHLLHPSAFWAETGWASGSLPLGSPPASSSVPFFSSVQNRMRHREWGCPVVFGYLFPRKARLREGVRLAPRLHRAALISRIKIPRQLLPKWLRAVQGGWETPGAVTGRRRQTKSSLRHSGSAPGGENQHTHTHTPRSTSPHSPRRPDTRTLPEHPRRAGDGQRACQYPSPIPADVCAG